MCSQVVLILEMASWAILELSSRLTMHGARLTEHPLAGGERRLACGVVAGRPEESYVCHLQGSSALSRSILQAVSTLGSMDYSMHDCDLWRKLSLSKDLSTFKTNLRGF